MSVQHKYRNIIQEGLYIDQIHQNYQQKKHFGRLNKMESKIELGHTFFEQHVSLPSLTLFPLTLKCHILMLISYLMIL